MVCTSPLEHMPLDTAPMGNLDWERGKRLWDTLFGFGHLCRYSGNVSLLWAARA